MAPLAVSIKDLEDLNAATEAALSEKVMEVDMKKIDLSSLTQDFTVMKTERSVEIDDLETKIAAIEVEYESCKENIGPKKPAVDAVDAKISSLRENLCNVKTSTSDLDELLEHYATTIAVAKHKSIDVNAAFDQATKSVSSNASALASAMEDLRKVQELERKCSRGALAEAKSVKKVSKDKTPRRSSIKVKKSTAFKGRKNSTPTKERPSKGKTNK